MNTQFTTKVDVNNTRKGDTVMVVTGSTKTRNLIQHVGVIVDYTIKNVEGTDYAFLNAVVKTSNGEKIESSRVYTQESITDVVTAVEAIMEEASIIPTIDETYPEHDAHIQMMEIEYMKYVISYRQHMTPGERTNWQIDYSRRFKSMCERRMERVQHHMELVAAILTDVV